MSYVFCLFGESRRGIFGEPMLFSELEELSLVLGEPLEGRAGGHDAIQILLYQYKLLFFRVQQEGVSLEDYYKGFTWLQKSSSPVTAMKLPGVGNRAVLGAAHAICQEKGSILVIDETDFYDFATG